MKQINVDFSELAKLITFDRDFNEGSIVKGGYQFRAGKTVADINNAAKLSQKQSGFKAEVALSFFETKLESIFKKKRLMLDSKGLVADLSSFKFIRDNRDGSSALDKDWFGELNKNQKASWMLKRSVENNHSDFVTDKNGNKISTMDFIVSENTPKGEAYKVVVFGGVYAFLFGNDVIMNQGESMTDSLWVKSL